MEDVLNLAPKRNKRIKYTKQQTEQLERAFDENHYPDTVYLEKMAMDLKVSLDRVSIWFQNRRSKFKRQRQTEHIAWMRKQVFSGEVATDLSTLNTPRLSVLTPTCQVSSPIDTRPARTDQAMTPQMPYSGTPGPFVDDVQTYVSHHSYHGDNETPQRYARQHPYWNQYMSPQLEENTQPYMPPFWNSYVPSMHSIAMDHVPRTPFSDVMVNSQSRSEQTIACVEVNLVHTPPPPVTNETKKVVSIEVDHSTTVTSPPTQASPVTSLSTKSSPKFKLFDSDSDDSPTKDLTLKLLSKWC